MRPCKRGPPARPILLAATACRATLNSGSPSPARESAGCEGTGHPRQVHRLPEGRALTRAGGCGGWQVPGGGKCRADQQLAGCAAPGSNSTHGQAGLAAPAVLLQAQRHGRAVEKAIGKRNWRPGGDYTRSTAHPAEGGTPSGKDEKGRGKGGGRGKGRGFGKGAWRAPGGKGAAKEGGKDGGGAAAAEAK